MTSSVFIKTQLEDLGFLEWALKFIRKNWKTESQFVVSAPHECTEQLIKMSDTLGSVIDLAPMDQWPERGYIHQQYMKMHADNYCNGELITYLDSDAMLVLPTDLEKDLCVDGKPIIWFTEYERLDAPWQYIVSQVMSLTPKHEFMRCFPITYNRSTLKACRERIQEMHGCGIEQLMHNAITWTEFNVLGFHAFVFEKPRYAWKHTDLMFTPEGLQRHWHDRVRQFHRTYDWNDATRELMEKYLNGEQLKDDGNREPDRADSGGLVGEERGPVKRPRKKGTATGRRQRVHKTDLPVHQAGVPGS